MRADCSGYIINSMNSACRRFASLVTSLLFMTGCTSLEYYSQSLHGQLEILQKRKPIEALLSDSRLSPTVATQLATVSRIRHFATAELGLPDNNSYRQYADLGRDYVVWNVFATPELSLEPKQWCFLFIGCLNYRGYFSKQAAHEFAAKLQEQGYDVFVGGVTAYSTLGWFDDPVLNTMLRHDSIYLTRVIFHELAHQQLYIKDDTEFNEAFAETVALFGTEKWLAKHGSDLSRQKYNQQQGREAFFIDLVMTYRKRLTALYQSNLSTQEKRAKKELLLKQMSNEYKKERAGWGNFDRYDNWFKTGLNNAKLMAVVTYRQYLPAFRQLLAKVNHDLNLFYQIVERLGQCSSETRRQILASGQVQFDC